jgi:solute carrier family 40 (iron-regulated transporter), member 1
MNSQMRRIDLFCKLVSPLAIALMDGASTKIAIQAIFWTSAASVAIEYALIARAYGVIPALAWRVRPDDHASLDNSEPTVTGESKLSGALLQCRQLLQNLKVYFNHPALLPSLSLSLLYLTVLSFSGQMVTYLLSAGYTSTTIGFVRSVSVVAEMSATWLAPLAMTKLGPIRAGIWFLNWQIICLTVAVGWFLIEPGPIRAASYLVAGVIASRIGLWGFDLCTQIIIQEVSSPCSHLVKFRNKKCRKSSQSTEGPSQLLKVHCRTFSNSVPSPRRRSSLSQINFGIQQ